MRWRSPKAVGLIAASVLLPLACSSSPTTGATGSTSAPAGSTAATGPGSSSLGARPPGTSASSGSTASSTTTRPDAPGTTRRAGRVNPTVVPGSTPTGEAEVLGPVFTVPVGGITMSYRQFGAGTDVVLVPGQAAPMSLWPFSTLQQLAATHRVTIYDNRGIGLTTDDTAVPLTMEAMADDLAGLTDALGLHRPQLFGWSTGGEIAMVAQVRHREHFGDVLVSGAMPGGPSTVEGPPANIAKFEDPATPPLELLPLLFGPDPGDVIGRFVADISKVEQTVVSPATTRRYAECEHAFVRGHDYLPDYAGLTGTSILTVANGEDDALVPAENARRIAGAVPGAVLDLQAGGHAWFVEYPDAFAALVEKALPA